MNASISKPQQAIVECQVDIGTFKPTNRQAALITERIVNALPKKVTESGMYDPWLNLPAQTKGKVSAMIVTEILIRSGIPVTNAATTKADRNINHKEVEIKSSSMWKTGIFGFQQIRPDDEGYEGILAVGFLPNMLYLWYIPRKDLQKFRNEGFLTPQHNDESEWLRISPLEPILEPYGGEFNEMTMDKIIALLR